MQTITNCHATTDTAALNAALEKFQGQGAWIERLTATTLEVRADGEETLKTTLAFIKGWTGGDADTASAAPDAPPAGVVLAVGEKVTHTTYTNAKAGYVESISPNGKTAMVRMANQTLLNGCNSGEPDALVCHPGGFAGHVEGKQRWAIEANPEGWIAKFTLRKRGAFWIWKLAGSATREPGNRLTKGHHPHYDFNF